MKGFDLYLQRSQRTDPDWTEHYIRYTYLKQTLKKYYKRRRSFKNLLRGKRAYVTEEDLTLVLAFGEKTVSPVPDSSGNEASDYFRYDDSTNQSFLSAKEASHRLSEEERASFSNLLETELRRATNYYVNTVLVNLKKVAAEATESSAYDTVANELLEAMSFIVVNVIAMRQILIRYNAFCRTYDGLPLTEVHMQHQLHDRVASDELPDLNQLESLLFVNSLFELEVSDAIEAQLSPKLALKERDALETQMNVFKDLLDKTSTSVALSLGGKSVFRDRFIKALRKYILFGFQTRGLMLEPKLLMMRGRHLKSEIKAVAKWRETSELSEDESGFKDRFKDMDKDNVFPLLLNLLSCFLWMMNNYIIEPSSAYYASALGSNDALSGMMLGAAPWFSLISAVGYSFWSNYSYKQPILFAAILVTIGNLLYACALSYNSMTMCLIGRAISGLGAPRIINRRYVADATPFSLRTAASASFAMATAIGSATGPGIAILLNMLDFDFYLPIFGKQNFNGMTGPGFLMSFCWALFSIVVLVAFKEPKRTGLDELRKRETSTPNDLSEELQLQEEEDDGDDGDDSDWEDHSTGSMVSSDKLSKSYDDDDIPTSSPFYCLMHITRPVVICMSLIFFKRIALESIVGSTSVITKHRYGWNITNVGSLHLANGIIVIPVSIMSGWLSQYHEDRYLALWFLAITFFGMMFLVDVTDFADSSNDTYNSDKFLSVGPTKYVIGSLIAFSGVEACESYTASLMSKVVPSALAVGTFNSGLLATLVGTSGRAVGDAFITAMGFVSIRNLLNLLIIPGASLMALSFFLIRYYYGILGF